MNSGLEYFKKVYKNVPGWVQVMHDYNPKMLDYYTALRGEAFKSDVLLDTEKDEIIAAVNAGRLYRRSMILHTSAGLNKGSKLEDLIEYLLVSGVYGGLNNVVLGLESIAHYLKEKDQKSVQLKETYESFEEVIVQLIEWTPEYDQSFLYQVKEKVSVDTKCLLEQGRVTKDKKYLCLVGMYITELKGKEATQSIALARENGVTDAQLADLGYIILLTAGIPSWFEMSDHLNPIEQ